jgi:hypothetical protein
MVSVQLIGNYVIENNEIISNRIGQEYFIDRDANLEDIVISVSKVGSNEISSYTEDVILGCMFHDPKNLKGLYSLDIIKKELTEEFNTPIQETLLSFMTKRIPKIRVIITRRDVVKEIQKVAQLIEDIINIRVVDYEQIIKKQLIKFESLRASKKQLQTSLTNILYYREEAWGMGWDDFDNKKFVFSVTEGEYPVNNLQFGGMDAVGIEIEKQINGYWTAYNIGTGCIDDDFFYMPYRKRLEIFCDCFELNPEMYYVDIEQLEWTVSIHLIKLYNNQPEYTVYLAGDVGYDEMVTSSYYKSYVKLEKLKYFTRRILENLTRLKNTFVNSFEDEIIDVINLRDKELNIM